MTWKGNGKGAGPTIYIFSGCMLFETAKCLPNVQGKQNNMFSMDDKIPGNKSSTNIFVFIC